MQSSDLASLIRFHRKRARLTQTALAAYARVGRSVVQDLEAGIGRTSWKNLVAVLNILNLTLEPEGPLVAAWRKDQERPES